MEHMTSTAEDFAALARSAPWRWTTLRFTLRRFDPRHPDDTIRAWVRRANDLRVESAAGQVLATTFHGAGRGVGVPLGKASLVAAFGPAAASTSDRFTVRDPTAVPDPTPGLVPIPLPDPDPAPGLAPSLPDAEQATNVPLPAPTFRPDGLVAARPTTESIGDFDAPFYENYYWTALLDPRELADGRSAGTSTPPAGTVIRDVVEIDHHGRPAWQATLTPTAEYEPRCGCCSLLRHRGTDIDEWGAGHDAILAEYPPAYRVRLDRATGVCVWNEAQGGSVDGTGHDVTIEAADEPMSDDLFTSR